MSDNPNPIQVPIRFTVESQRAAQSINEIQELVGKTKKRLDEFAKDGGLGRLADKSGLIKSANKTVDELGASLVDTNREIRNLRLELERTDRSAAGSDAYDSLVRDLDRATNSAKELEKQLLEIPDATALGAVALRRQQVSTSLDAISGLGSLEGIFTNTRGLVQSGGSAVGVDPRTIEALSKALELSGDLAGTVDSIPRAIKGIQDVKSSLSALQAAGVLTAGSIATTTASLGALALAAYGVSVAYKQSIEDATKPVQAFLDNVQNVDVSTLDATSIKTTEQLQFLAEQQREYQDILQTNIGNNAFILEQAETFGQNADDLAGQFGGFVRNVADAFNLPQFEQNITALENANKGYNEQLTIVEANLALLTSGLLQLSFSSQEATTQLLRQLEIEQQRQILLETATPAELSRLRDQARRDLLVRESNLQAFQDSAIDGLVESVKKSSTELTTDQAQQFFEALQLENPEEKLNQLRALAALYGIEIPAGVQTSIDAYDNQLKTINKLKDDLDLYSDAAVNAAASTRAGIQSLQDRQKKDEESAKSEQKRGEAISALTEVNNAAIAAENKRLDAIGNATQDYQSAVAELETFQATLADKARERQQEAERELVREDYRRQIAAAKEAEAEAERIQKVNAARLKANDEIQEVERKAQAESLKAARRYQKDRLDAENDLRDGLADAALNNDVNAFIAAKKAGDKELDRIEDEHREQETERQNQARETTQNIIRQLREQERAELSQRGQTITRSMQLEQQLARIEEQWRVQDAQRRFQLEQQASNQRLQLLQNEVIEARNIIRLLQQPNLIRPAVNTAVNTISNVIGSVGNLIRFADGGIVTRPTLALLGEGKTPEAILPFRPSEGIGRAARRAGLGSTYQVTVNVGELATPEDIRAVKAEVYSAILQADMAILKEVV